MENTYNLSPDSNKIMRFLISRLQEEQNSNNNILKNEEDEVTITERPMSSKIGLSTRRIRRSFDELSDQGLIEKRIYNYRTVIRVIYKDINLEFQSEN